MTLDTLQIGEVKIILPSRDMKALHLARSLLLLYEHENDLRGEEGKDGRTGKIRWEHYCLGCHKYKPTSICDVNPNHIVKLRLELQHELARKMRERKAKAKTLIKVTPKMSESLDRRERDLEERKQGAPVY